MMTGKLPSQFGKRERLETFSKYFLPGEERREMVMLTWLVATTVVPGFVCLVGFVTRSQQEREREMSSVNVNTIPARHRNHPPLSWKISKNNLEI